MQRQHTYNVGPGCTPPSAIPNDVLLERGGDDSTVYFVNRTDQLLMGTGPAPLDLASAARPLAPRSGPIEKPVQTPAMGVACLRPTPKDTTQAFVLHGGGASAKVFLDAWEPWQTVPLNITIEAPGPLMIDTRYSYEFVNYVPLGPVPVRGKGVAKLACPWGVESAPTMKTQGNTNRSPRGEFPVSQATREALQCCHEDDRPYLVVRHEGPKRGASAIRVTVSIAQ